MSNAAGKRYAKALFELAKEKKSLKAVEAHVEDLASIVEENPALSELFQSPLASRSDQVAVVEGVAKKAKFSPLLANTLKLMGTKGRLNLVPELISNFRELMIADREEIVAEVTSATALTAAQIKKLADSLKDKMGKSVTITTQIDESLIGGLLIKVGSTMIDSSVKGKLSKIHNAMKEVG